MNFSTLLTIVHMEKSLLVFIIFIMVQFYSMQQIYSLNLSTTLCFGSGTTNTWLGLNYLFLSP